MAESLASLFASGTETYVLQRMSELEKKMDVVNADYLQLSWRLAESYDENAKLSARIVELERKVSEVDAEYLLTETLDENAKLSARIAELERKVDVVDTEYVQVSSDRWLSVKDTKTLRLSHSLRDILRPNMLCKLINLETLYINDIKPDEVEIYANKNVSRIEMSGPKLPNLENFPSCHTLTININGCRELKVSTVISTLSSHKHNIQTLSISADGYGEFVADLKNLENYCKISGIAWERHK